MHSLTRNRLRWGSSSGGALVVVLGVLAVISTGVAAVAVVLQIQEREHRQAKERELQLVLSELDELKGRLDALQQAKAQVEEELTQARTELTASQEALAKAVEAQETLSRSVEGREREISRLKTDLEQATDTQKDLSAQLAQLQTERDEIKQRLLGLEQAKGELESQVSALSTGEPTVELDKVRVTSEGEGTGPSAAAAPGGSENGQIIVVNRDYDFVVMNLGKNQGLSIGQEFQIVRGEVVLGKVKVEKVYEELSAAAILPESDKSSIREGDAVKAL